MEILLLEEHLSHVPHSRARTHHSPTATAHPIHNTRIQAPHTPPEFSLFRTTIRGLSVDRVYSSVSVHSLDAQHLLQRMVVPSLLWVTTKQIRHLSVMNAPSQAALLRNKAERFIFTTSLFRQSRFVTIPTAQVLVDGMVEGCLVNIQIV